MSVLKIKNYSSTKLLFRVVTFVRVFQSALLFVFLLSLLMWWLLCIGIIFCSFYCKNRVPGVVLWLSCIVRWQVLNPWTLEWMPRNSELWECKLSPLLCVFLGDDLGNFSTFNTLCINCG